ncbi:TonB-dependent receptor plug domain-containing protein [Phenylobacterium sp.]|uniref:TonB-dependent receptor plug domain-containing protein n=1 Tax=Phenylobacterium sp. TaxID=1871053 RepID=UPI0035B4BA10
MLLIHALAQAAAAVVPEAAAQPQQGVISYPPSFFESFRPTSALEMVERVPGFTFDAGDSVRGFEGAAGNVLIDGQRPAAKSDPLGEILNRIPAGQVERIDLIRGSAPGIDMQGKTVLVNVVRKAGGGFRGLIAASTRTVADDGRTLSAFRLEGSGGSNGRAWEAGVLLAQGVDDGTGDGPRVRLDPAGRPLIRSDVEAEGGVAVQAIVTGAYETPFLGGRLRLNARLFAEEFNYDEQNRITFPALATEFDQWGEDAKEVELGARDTRSLGANTSLETVLLQRNEDKHFGETFREPGETVLFALDRKTGESIGRTVLKHRRSDALSFEAGAEGAFNWLESETEYFLNGQAQPLPAGSVRVEETRGELFGKATWRPRASLTLEAGLRQEASRISSEGDVELEKTLYFTKPRFSASWAPDAVTQVRFRVERKVDQLDFDDFVAETEFNTGGEVQAGNPDLDPEQSWETELALERRFWGSGAVVLTLSHEELTDVIDRAPVFGATGVAFDAPANIGSGQEQELGIDLTLPLDRLGVRRGQLRGFVNWERSEVTDPTTGRKRRVSGSRPVEWEAHFTHDVPQWRVTWGVDAFGAWRETYYRFNEVKVLKLKTFVTPFVDWKPRADITVRAEIQNLTERGFRETRYRYTGARSTGALEYVDDRDIQVGRIFYVRVRKTLGG